MERVQVISHRGREIIFTDLSGTAEIEEQTAILNRAEALIRSRPPASVLSLIDYSGARYGLRSVEIQKNFSAAVTPYMKASAVTGISGMMRIILRSVVRITGRNIRDFPGIEQAKDWLASA